jgi:hypothetical protein
LTYCPNYFFPPDYLHNCGILEAYKSILLKIVINGIPQEYEGDILEYAAHEFDVYGQTLRIQRQVDKYRNEVQVILSDRQSEPDDAFIDEYAATK